MFQTGSVRALAEFVASSISSPELQQDVSGKSVVIAGRGLTRGVASTAQVAF
jgi:hypothetical protein